MKTIITWLSFYLPTEVRDKAINNTFHFCTKNNIDTNDHFTRVEPSLCSAIGSAFNWTETEEGHSYWEKMCNADKKFDTIQQIEANLKILEEKLK